MLLNTTILHRWLTEDKPFWQTLTNTGNQFTNVVVLSTYPGWIVDFDKLSDGAAIKRRQQATGGRQ